jgi:ketosteroid isomerase-like protein
MTASTATNTDVDVVRAVFGAFASGDLATLSDLLHADATWHHRNDDRLGDGHVAVPVRLRASRPDGRSMDGPQVVLVDVEGGRVRAIEQFVGDPAAVAAFWA